MERAAVILWWTEFVSMLRLSRCAKPSTTCFWHLLEGNGFFRARLAARGSYRRGPSPGEGAIERDERLSRSSKGDAEDDEARRICERNARRQGRHIGNDGRTRDRPMSANAMVLTVMTMSMVFTGKSLREKPAPVNNPMVRVCRTCSYSYPAVEPWDLKSTPSHWILRRKVKSHHFSAVCLG